MIYEKRHGKVLNIRPDDMACKVRIVSCSDNAQTKQFDAISVSSPKDKPRCRTRFIKKRRKFSSLAAITLCLAVCVLTADFRLFDGKVSQGLISHAKSFMSAHFMDSSPAEDVSSLRTIYTLTYADGYSEKEVQADASDTEVSFSGPSESTPSITVDSSKGFASVDGDKYYPITALDLSKDIYSLSNDTSFDIDMKSILETRPEILDDIRFGSEPLVLILHTHGCEAYSSYTDMYPENEPNRSENKEKNVTRVGSEIASTLSAFGISAIHCDVLHDKDSFINAYSQSAKTVNEYLAKYPSIKFVLDIHRDAIIRDSGESIKPLTNIAGEDFAQIMFVVGTNELGHNHPDWQKNLSLAAHLQALISDTYPTLCRSINLRDVPFNQQLSDGYLLVEFGSCGNTLEEVLRSARAFGNEFARFLLQQQNI